jgi:hypothetical protein
MDWTATMHALDAAGARRRWKTLWAASPQRSAFTSLAYARAAAAVYDLKTDLHLITGDGQTAEAGAIVYWRRRGPYRQVVLPPMTQYSPLLLHTSPRESDLHHRRSALEALLAALESRYHHLRLFCPDLPDVRVCQWRGWKTTPFYTYRLPLGEGDLFGAWSSSTRATFRKHRTDYHVTEHPEAAPEIVSLCEAGYERHDRSLPVDRNRLLSLIGALHQNGQVRLFTAVPTGSECAEAGIAVLHDGRMAHYWIAGSEPGPAMTVLIGVLLEQLQKEGFEWFDFVGANTPSIAEFKRRFGPSLEPYYLLETSTRPELRLIHALRR